MATSPVCLLIADLPVVASALRQTLPLDQVDVLEAHTFDEATGPAERRHPNIYIIGYHFDEMRPYRLVRHVRSMGWATGTRILFSRALPLRQPASEEEALRKAYVSIGADDYPTAEVKVLLRAKRLTVIATGKDEPRSVKRLQKAAADMRAL